MSENPVIEQLFALDYGFVMRFESGTLVHDSALPTAEWLDSLEQAGLSLSRSPKDLPANLDESS
jgi:hypothetical protein